MTLSNRRRRSVAQRVNTVATILLLCCIDIWTSQALAVSYHEPDFIQEPPKSNGQHQEGSDSPEVPPVSSETRRVSSTLVNQHALLQVQATVVCTLSNEAKASIQESSSHGSRRVEEQLDMDTRWVITINELPQSILDDHSSLYLDQAFVLNWSTYDDFRYKGHASFSFLIPLQQSATVDERTVIVTLMENSGDGHPRITSRRLANLPLSPSHSDSRNSRANMVVNVELCGSTTCAYDYKADALHQETLPPSSGVAGLAIALVACIVAYAFPKDRPHYVAQDEAAEHVVALLPSTSLHLPERPRVENDGTIESSGHVSVGSLVENESVVCRRDDSTESDASTLRSGQRIERPPQVVRIPCAFIFTEDEESVAYDKVENRHAFPSPDVAEPNPFNDELGEKEADSEAMDIMESVGDSRKTSLFLVEGMANQEVGDGEPSAHSVADRGIKEGMVDIMANEIDSQKLTNTVDEDETVDRGVSIYEMGNSEQEERFIDYRQTMEVTVDDMEPMKTSKIAVEDTSEKNETDVDASSVAVGDMDQRTRDVVDDASEPNTTTKLTDNPFRGRRSKVMDLEYLPVTELSNWPQRLRERPTNKVTSFTTVLTSSIAEEDFHPVDQRLPETVTDKIFVRVDDDDRDGASHGRASEGVSYVSTLPADSDTTCSPMNDWPQTDLDAATDFAHHVDGELESEPSRDDARRLKRKRRFDPFQSHRTNIELLPSASIHLQRTYPVKPSSRKQASTTNESSCVSAHHIKVDAVPTSQIMPKKSFGVKKELKRSTTSALLPDIVPSLFLQSFCTQQIDAPVPWDFTLSTSLSKGGTRKRQRDNGKRRKGPPTTIEILGDSRKSCQSPKSSQRAVSRDSSIRS